MSQYLYVVTSPETPGKAWLLRSVRSPLEREGGQEEVPPPEYTIAHCEPVARGFAAEQLAHILLMEAGYRPDDNKNGYEIALPEIIQLVKRAAREISMAFGDDAAEPPASSMWSPGCLGVESDGIEPGDRVPCGRRSGAWTRWLSEARPRIVRRSGN
ncbi:hypothetical protein CAL29_19775 [Bordetella genomosp. 10]|uniref:Uncharacterized protein n=1 Tax=Bordetella genomosp. 10 TaxID=1416804 RepID=A0A261S0H3_9BORD|nr:GIY-YIG nuclease family protein [Bordetella genomosp. 10]OZI30290.1 hypothetical protein CAL29_19775 [Bordetella genomosp. 10]